MVATRIFQLIIFSSFLYFLAQPIFLLTADLGRHLKNGELVLAGQFDVLTKNTYSFTSATYPFINHHWLSGVLFFLVHKLGGFLGLHLFFLLLAGLTLYLLYVLANQYSTRYVALFSVIVFIPIIASRREIRPEIFSYFLSAIFILILTNVLTTRMNYKWLYLLIALQVLWVNLHIYFFLGFMFISAFIFAGIVENMVRTKSLLDKRLRHMLIVAVLMFAISFINPNGIAGVLYPLSILNQYGIRTTENQPFWVVRRVIPYPTTLYLVISYIVVIISWLFGWRRFQYNMQLAIVHLLFTFGAVFLSLQAVRNSALYGYLMVPVVAMNVYFFSLPTRVKTIQSFSLRLLICLILFTFLYVAINLPYWTTYPHGLGLVPNTEKYASLFLRNSAQGPIFNNFDIGSYLIYYLYPKYQVFVDNRPEAYPTSFLTEAYNASLLAEGEWLKLDSKYRFKTIFMYRLQTTDELEYFFQRRQMDPRWVLVYVDNDVVIFVKRTQQIRPESS